LAVIRVRRCVVRAVVRQPWRLEDPDALSAALTRLVVDVLVPRLAGQLDRVGQAASLGTVALRLALPPQVVLGLAGETPASSGGRRLEFFGAELAVHAAISSALRVAVERQGAEPDDLGPALPGGGLSSRRAFSAATGRRATPPEREAGVPATPTAVGRLAASVRATLLAASRRDRLWRLLGRCDPALLAEWAQLLRGQLAWEPIVPPTPPGPGHPGPVHQTIPTAPAAAGPLAPPSPPPAAGRPAGAATVGPPAAPATDDPSTSTADGPVEGPGEGTSTRAVQGRAADATAAPPADTDREPSAHTDRGSPDDTAWEPKADADQGWPAESEPWLVVDAARAPPADATGGSPAGAAEKSSTRPADAALEAVLDALNAAAGARSGRETPRPPGPGDAAPQAGPAAASGPGRLGPAGIELQLASVLPFLLVGPLDDLGVLDAAAAALTGPGWPDLLAAFAGCLARKALPPPGAGWLQPPHVTATVAAFTGRTQAPDAAACERLGQTVARWWPVVHEAVAAELTELHAHGSPLLAMRSPGGLVMADADGLVPLLWDADADAATRLWEDCDRPPLLIHPVLAPAGLQALRPIPDRALTRPLAELVALAYRRPAAGRAGLAPELEAPLSLLAGVGLAALAWELWRRHGERTHPGLAIGRLGDLDGRVRLGPDAVTVQMPLGRRHADLRDSGLLRTVGEVPWLQGRRLELLGG
jgi:hypothetical protein